MQKDTLSAATPTEPKIRRKKIANNNKNDNMMNEKKIKLEIRTQKEEEEKYRTE